MCQTTECQITEHRKGNTLKESYLEISCRRTGHIVDGDSVERTAFCTAIMWKLCTKFRKKTMVERTSYLL